jgi:DNA-binding transcriptional regulator YdaS (Cro superfamily)
MKISSSTWIKLKDAFGNHTKAAKALCVSPRHYREWRSGRFEIPKWRIAQIEMILKERDEPTLFFDLTRTE